MSSGNWLRLTKRRSPYITAARRTSPASWNASLRRAIRQIPKPFPRIAIVGVGHELRGDDAAGIEAARALQTAASQWLLIVDAGSAPENVTGTLRRFAPDLVVLIDALHSGRPPGTICLLDVDQTQETSTSTHTLSLHVLAAYLKAELGCDVILVGIEAGQDNLGASLSPVVRQSVQALVRTLRRIVQRPLNYQAQRAAFH